MKRFVLSPSDLGWLLADCERCFARQARFGVRRPGGPPDAFSAADRAMKAYFEAGVGTVRHGLGVGPPFVVVAQNFVTESAPLAFDDLDLEIVVRGKLDALVRTDDDRTLVVDYKTKVRDVPIDATYAPQLQAYALGLEHPKPGIDACAVDGLALLVYNASRFAFKCEAATSGLFGATDWVDVARDDAAFLDLLRRVATLLAGAEPRPNPNCVWCKFYGAVPLMQVGGAA